ncbi:hypothetical protein GGC47_002015 [Bosea sp. OAE752]|uniref:hypothetical protein n=1 Tax=Bosea sp. OAE752 TaxID=2663873 RepID=UPI003D207A39
MTDYLDKIWGLLKLSGWQLVMVSCASFLGLWLFGPVFGPIVSAGLAIAGVFAGALAAAALITWFASPTSYPNRSVAALWSKRADRERFRRHIPLLTQEEKQILGYLLHHSRRTFETDLSGELASGLIALGFARFIGAPNQAFTANRRPVEIPEHIWQLVVENRAQFPHQPRLSPGGREVFPWKRHWAAGH